MKTKIIWQGIAGKNSGIYGYGAGRGGRATQLVILYKVLFVTCFLLFAKEAQLAGQPTAQLAAQVVAELATAGGCTEQLAAWLGKRAETGS